MELMHSDLDSALLSEARLEASFLLRPDGSVSRASDALLRLCSIAPATGLVRLYDLVDHRSDAEALLRWLRHSRGLGVLSLQTQVRVGPRSRLAVELLATALPMEGGMQAFCAVRTPVHSPLREAELEQQLRRQEVRLQQLRQDQAALLDSEFRWRFAVEGSGEGVWDWDVRSGDAVFSPLWKSILGYTDSEIAPRFEEWRDRIHPQDLERVLDVVGQYLQSEGGSYRVEFRMRCKDGSYIWIASRGMAAVRDRNGKPLRIIGTHRSIAERVRQRLLLEQNEAKLRAITDNARTIMFMKDPDGRYLHINRRFEEVFRLPRQDLLGKTDFDVFPAQLAERYQANDRLVMESGQAQEMEEEGLHPVDGIRTYLTVKVPIRDEMGQMYAICGISTDITDRKRMENELRVAAVAFESPISMIVTDARLVIQRVNKAFVESTGYSAEEAVGQTPRLLVSGRHDPAFYAAMWCTIQECGSWQGEIWGRRKNGVLYPKWLSIYAVKDRAGCVSHYVGTETDISERKQAEAALRKLNQKLREQKKQLSQLVAQNEAARESERKHIAREVHDELGQVLTALRMDTNLIAMRFGGMDEALQRKILDMRALVDDAIQGVRDVTTHLRPMALDMGLYLALEWLCNDFVKRTGTPCLLDTMDRQIELDEARAVVVFRIVQESLTNISRYACASQVFVTLALGDNELAVEVQDNGVGFDIEQVERGKTFGLLGMNERALALDGRLEIVSAPGQGTTIGLTIPYRRSADGTPP